MQDIDKFGFNLVNLAKKENYPWASPEAAIESELQMSPEEFMQNSFELISEFEAGTEGFISDAWTWFTNLIKKFWNWITGNNKKEKAKIEKVEEKIKTLNREYKNPPSIETDTNSIKEDMLRNKEEFNKAMSDPSTTLEIGADGVKAKHVYWAPVSINKQLNTTDKLSDSMIDLKLLKSTVSLLTSYINESSTFEEFSQDSNKCDELKDLIKYTQRNTSYINDISSRLELKSYDTIREAAGINTSYYGKLKELKQLNVKIEEEINKLNTAMKNIKSNKSSDNNTSKHTNIFIQFMTKDYPNYKKSIDNFITKLDKLYGEAIKRNRISAKANGLGGESEEFDFDVEFDNFEPFIYEGTESFFDYYIGTEGFIMDKVKDAWDWIKALIKRFLKWITGRSKNDKAKEKTVKKSVEENINILRRLERLLKSDKSGGKESLDIDLGLSVDAGIEAIDIKKLNIAHSKLNEIFDNSGNIMYVTVNTNSVNFLGATVYDILHDLVLILSFLPKSARFDGKFESKESLIEFYDNAVEKDENNIKIITKSKKGLSGLHDAIKELENITKGYDFEHYISGTYYYNRILDQMDKINDTIDRIDSNNMQLDPDVNKKVMAIADAVYNHILPNYQKEREKRMNELNKQLVTIKKMNYTFYNKYLIAVKQAEAEYNDVLGVDDDYKKKYDPVSYSSHVKELGGQLKNANGLESVFGFVTTPSITSEYAYEGLEEEYTSIKKLLSECDAEANEYFDGYVFFGGTEGFVDTVKLYGHKIWDAIRRFFMWIASKFSDKYKEKYELEKMRALFNSLVTDYADYVKYDDYHKGVQDLKNMADDLRNSLNSSEESVNIFRLTSGLESEDYTLTVTNYEEMNNSIEEIADDAKDLAKFTKYFIDMVATGKANSKDFRALITKDLQDLPGKLNKIKFPGTKVITPKDAKEFKEEVNTAIDYCKEFKTIIDYMNKHKSKVDKFFENPELKDNSLAKEMIAAMNRYFVPSVKSISNIIDWYVRCINTDIKKLKNATK